MRTSEVTIDAESRGRMRLWLQRAAVRYERFDHAYNSKEVKDLVVDLGRKSSRTRAWLGLERMLRDCAQLEIKRLDGRAPVSVWSVVNPREAVACASADGGGLDPALMQNCVVIEYFIVGTLPVGDKVGIGEASGLWTVEVPVHALGRLMQRDPTADVDAVLLELHHAVLNARVEPFAYGQTAIARAGRGAFLCTFQGGPDVSLGGAASLYVRAETWIDERQLRPEQEVAADALAAGPGQEKLGDGLLLPAPLRVLALDDDGGVRAVYWGQAPKVADVLAGVTRRSGGTRPH
jgi:hypothetical protein